MAQTSYTQNFAVAFAGMLSQASARFQKIVSKTVGSTSASIPGGCFVCRDTTDDSVKLPSSSGMVTTTGVGFMVHDVAKQPQASDGGILENVTGQVCPVMEYGTMWVLAEVAVSYGDPVFARYSANGGLTQLGAVRNDADTAHAAAVPGCRFIGTIAAAGLVEIERVGFAATGATGPTGPTGP